MWSANEKKVVLISCGDLHLSEKAPACRAEEKDWLATQVGYLGQLAALRHKHKADIVCTGDIFDKWNSTARLINLVLETIPRSMRTIPGNHDLAYHNLANINQTAYWTLRNSDAIEHLQEDGPPGWVFLSDGRHVRLHAFPYGAELHGLDEGGTVWSKSSDKSQGALDVAVVHKYTWMGGHKHPGAKEEDHVTVLMDKLTGYDTILIGDNHKPFETVKHLRDDKYQYAFNGGGFMRRRSDEKDLRPSVGLVMSDGSVERHYLDISRDVFSETVSKEVEESEDSIEFIQALSGLQDETANFFDAVKRKVEGLESKTLRKLILELLSTVEGKK